MSLTINEYPLIYILWNLFLAMIPFFLFYLLRREISNKQPSWFRVIIILGTWLLFLPNSAYIINETRHIISDCPLTYDRVCANEVWLIPFFFTYALLGYLIFVWQIRQARILIEELGGKTLSYISVPVLIVIDALGVMIGLVERFNSWDVLWRLNTILTSLLDYLLVSEKLFNWLIYSLMLIIMYIIGEITIRFVKNRNI